MEPRPLALRIIRFTNKRRADKFNGSIWTEKMTIADSIALWNMAVTFLAVVLAPLVALVVPPVIDSAANL
jgi:uncharacterized membrane-anchored protein